MSFAKLLRLLISGVAAFMLLMAVILAPLAYFDGSAKSEWLKKTRNVDIEWYRATFLDVKIGDQNIEIK